jgi:hypothetical protein
MPLDLPDVQQGIVVGILCFETCEELLYRSLDCIKKKKKKKKPQPNAARIYGELMLCTHLIACDTQRSFASNKKQNKAINSTVVD